MTARAIVGLVFDVQGTLLDFFTPVSRAVGAALAERGLETDPAAIVNAWRRTYFEAAAAVAAGAPFRSAAQVYRDGLDAVLDARPEGRAFTAADRDALSEAWTRLVPWPDTVAGLCALRPHHMLAALSNGGMGATIAMTQRHDLAFHAVLTGELVRSYKPSSALYRLAIASLGVPAEQLMMVASHPYDLEAARRHGMRTAFIHRPLEYGPAARNDAAPPAGTDLVAADLHDLVRQLGAHRAGHG